VDTLKKLSIAIVTLALLINSINHATGGGRADLSIPLQGINITENYIFIATPPALYSVMSFGKGDEETWTLCKGLADPMCVAAPSINVSNQLPPCDASITTNCVQSVYAIDSTGAKTEGIFQKLATSESQYDYPASEINNLPQGKGQGGIWKIPGVTHSGAGDSYFVSTVLRGWLEKPANTRVTTEEVFFGGFESAIAPVNELSGMFAQSYPVDSTLNDGSGKKVKAGSGLPFGGESAYMNSCVMVGSGVCYTEKEFPKDYRFGMTVKLAKKLSGWFHGRIYNPIIDVIDAGKGQTLTFEAFPVLVPALYEKVPTANLTPELRSYLSSNREFSMGSSNFMPGNSGKDALEMAGFWIPVVKDKATSSRTSWIVRNLDGNQDADVRSCSSEDGKLAGIVTTNSLVYSAGPPTYNKAEGSLDYTVLSPHYTAAGEEAIGSYDLVLRSDVARCIYGFSRAPIQATISIINPEGDNKVATTLVREKNGWLTLSAKGFTYSSPTIRVTLSQEAEPTPEVTAKPVAPKVTKKAQSITCLKGKVKKVVKGANPACPKGFKKQKMWWE
jgi:hypothetical protein